MPGALAALPVNERRREADSQGLQRKKEGSDDSLLQAGLFPVSCQRVTTRGWGWREDRPEGDSWEGALNLG